MKKTNMLKKKTYWYITLQVTLFKYTSYDTESRNLLTITIQSDNKFYPKNTVYTKVHRELLDRKLRKRNQVFGLNLMCAEQISKEDFTSSSDLFIWNGKAIKSNDS